MVTSKIKIFDSDQKLKISDKKRKKETENIMKDSERDIVPKKKQERQLIVILVVIGIILILFLTVYFLYQKGKKFEYFGMEFERIMYGELPLYYTQLVIHREGAKDYNYNLYLRKDPRSNNMPVDAEIKFKDEFAYVTIDEIIDECKDASLSLINLGSFLRGVGISAKGATSDLITSVQEKVPLVNCELNQGITIISLEWTNGTNEILQDDKNPECYKLKISNCDVINVTEKFATETIKQKWVGK